MPHHVPLSRDIFDVMLTMRAMRRLKPDPVPDELVFQILRAGQAAASGGNTQRWKFFVLKDAVAKKKAVQVFYRRLFEQNVGPRYRTGPVPPGSSRETQLRQMAANEYLTDHYHEAPIWIVCCLEGENPNHTAGSSIYPAVQNMLLAARTLGLGSVLTTRHTGHGKECDEAMGIPAGYKSYAILPIGWPMGNFGPVGRGALADVVYLDDWGKAYPGLE